MFVMPTPQQPSARSLAAAGWIVLLIAVAWTGVAGAEATDAAALAQEEAGFDTAPVGPPPVPDPQAHEAALGMLPASGLLLVPESTNDRVMAFDPFSGDLVDADFIPADPTNLSTPIHAILSSDGASVLVSDQLEDVVQQYALDGSYLGVFAPAGGVNNAILDNVRGIALRPNGNLLVTVGSGTNEDAVAEFDTAGTSIGNFVANGAGGLDSPFDVVEVTVTAGSVTAGEWLVGGITSSAIHRYDSAGGALASLAPLDSFPEQVYQIPSGANAGNVLVADFIGAQEGVVELAPDGTVIDIYDPASLGGNRGVYELGNGNILTTNGDGVHEIDRTGALVETEIAGVSARFIEFVQGGAPTATATPPSLLATQAPDVVSQQVLSLGNDGDADLTWTLAEAETSCDAPSDVPWLSASPLGGTVVPGDTAPIDVTFDSTGLAAGTYEALLCIESNDPAGVLAVPVTLIVQASILEIPTLSGWGALMLGLALALLGVAALRR